MQLLQQLKGFDAESVGVDEMMALLAFGTTLAATYKEVSDEVPEWLEESIAKLKVEIERRQRDELERQLKEVQGRREALKSADEKRNDLAEKEQRLLKKLGKAG